MYNEHRVGKIKTYYRVGTIVVGDGSRIKFWSDAWCGTVSLKGTFPQLCHITQDKEALVADHMHLHNGSVHWQINFIQAAQDRELESLSSFLDLSYSIDVQGHEEDKLCSSQSSGRVSRLKLTIEFLPPLELGIFLGKAFGSLKFQQK